MTTSEKPLVSGAFLSPWRRASHWLLDLIFPPRCAHCGRVDTYWCADCAARLAALPVRTFYDDLEPFSSVLATSHHEGILQSAIHALKYYGQRQLAVPLGQRLAAALQLSAWPIDTLLPIPTHTNRERKRGYNQAKEIAHAIGERLQVDVEAHAILRSIDTRSQVGLNARERRANVADAFSAVPASLVNRNVLIVDDVRTTGATLRACAIAALEAGAHTVYAASVTVAKD